MKAFILNRRPGTNLDPATQLEPIVPASAIVASGKPLFLPDFAERWTLEIAVAFRLSRLGKSVSPKFASRYIDSMAAVALLRPQSTSLSPGLIRAFDGAMALGNWMVFDTSVIEIRLETDPNVSFTFSPNAIAPYEAASHLSRFLTLQMGDVLIPSLTGYSIPLPDNPPADHSLHLNGQLSLKVKIR